MSSGMLPLSATSIVGLRNACFDQFPVRRRTSSSIRRRMSDAGRHDVLQQELRIRVGHGAVALVKNHTTQGWQRAERCAGGCKQQE